MPPVKHAAESVEEGWCDWRRAGRGWHGAEAVSAGSRSNGGLEKESNPALQAARAIRTMRRESGESESASGWVWVGERRVGGGGGPADGRLPGSPTDDDGRRTRARVLSARPAGVFLRGTANSPASRRRPLKGTSCATSRSAVGRSLSS